MVCGMMTVTVLVVGCVFVFYLAPQSIFFLPPTTGFIIIYLLLLLLFLRCRRCRREFHHVFNIRRRLIALELETLALIQLMTIARQA